ncbi:MAG TPA: hypothetical protein VNS22_27040 [Geminicoccus sp.]|uniref:hypothetical protein n=1 Tax=Geminicoccus sp. TaxID=2024832 RepID=UPI002B940D21|nr:hypothetical protein [Geminicoccus sp.]HWL72017.1 hypothetical protein [Geminicoccus sp.]
MGTTGRAGAAVTLVLLGLAACADRPVRSLDPEEQRELNAAEEGSAGVGGATAGGVGGGGVGGPTAGSASGGFDGFGGSGAGSLTP